MESREKGPINSLTGFLVNNEGVGVIRNFGATKFTSSATYVTKFKIVQGAWVQMYGSTTPTANAPVFFRVTFSGATVYVRANTAALGTATKAATIDLYVKGLYR